MTTEEYSKAVLIGLESSGILRDEMARVTGLPMKRIAAVFAAKDSLTDNQLQKIEIATGKTAGQLALLSVENPDRDLSELFNQWAKTTEAVKPTKSKQKP